MKVVTLKNIPEVPVGPTVADALSHLTGLQREPAGDVWESLEPPTREELLGLLRELGERLGRVPTAKDVDANRGWLPSKSLYWHTFGSLTNALREAGFDVPVGEERLERAIEQGAQMALRLGRLPKFNDWAAARREDAALLTEWQVYRMFDARRGAWSTFQYLVRERLREEGTAVERDGSVKPKSN